ncbi:MAG: hypothetical protein LBP26_03975 [Clostridiales bacterium]|nr:hypothetical protein [Clostridiales bacterium]
MLRRLLALQTASRLAARFVAANADGAVDSPPHSVVPQKFPSVECLASLTGFAPAAARPANGKPFGGSVRAALTAGRLN